MPPGTTGNNPSGRALPAKCLAKAVYPNISEYPHELSFNKGDFLRVISKKPDVEGLGEGWWLCQKTDGQRGIVPANRLEEMSAPFDSQFFQVARPLMDEFFSFHSPFEDPFFGNGDRGIGFPSAMRERLQPQPLRRLNSMDDALRPAGTTGIPPGSSAGVPSGRVRNIPIRVEDSSRFSANPALVSSERHLNRLDDDYDKRYSDVPHFHPPRRTYSTGRISPPLVPERRSDVYQPSSFNIEVTPRSRSPLPFSENGSGPPRSRNHDAGFATNGATVSSDEEEPVKQRSLIIPSSIPGRSIEIPLGVSREVPRKESKEKDYTNDFGERKESQMDKLTQRLRQLASKPFRSIPVYVPSDNGRDPVSVSTDSGRDSDSLHSVDSRSLAPKDSFSNSLPPKSTFVRSFPSKERADSLEPRTLSQKERSPSPSSSGICADITDSNSGEENKRSSDLSSLSAGSDQNSFSDSPEELRLHPPAVVRGDRHIGSITKEANNRESLPSSSVLQNVFDNVRRPDLNAHNNSLNLNHRGWAVPVSLEEDMRRNSAPYWNHVPTTVYPPSEIGAGKSIKSNVNDANSVGLALDEELEARKRVVCHKMSDSLRMILNAQANIKKATSACGWRSPHLLQSHLNGLRDSVATVNEALDHFVDSTGRISIQRSSPKHEELSRLLAPLVESRSLVGCLRKALDLAGWTVSVLSRSPQNKSVDSLEQFIAILPQIPSDCERLLSWVQSLAPSSTVVFLSPTAHVKVPFSHPTSSAQSQLEPIRANDERPPVQLLNALSEELKRLSTSSGSTVTSADSNSTPSSILVTKHAVDKPRQRVTFADQPRDRSNSESSYEHPEYATIKRSPANGSIMNGQGIRDRYDVTENARGRDNEGIKDQSRRGRHDVIEEEDLESVASDSIFQFQQDWYQVDIREFQDYAYLDDVVPGRSTDEKFSLDEEDRQLLRFYATQLTQHTGSLSVAIEDFLEVVENNLPPKDFVHKGKLVILAAHKLIYIGDTISQCVHARDVADALRDAADSLCERLKYCVKATKTAADEYPEIPSMQTMVDSILSVSKAAHQLKNTIERCYS